MKEILKINNLIKKFPKTGGEIDDEDAISVLKGISFDVEEGEYVAIMGPSGSGKTTLLNIIGALDLPTSGRICMEGKDLTTMSEYEREELRRKQMGFVFQAVSLIPTMNAFQNVEFSMRLSGVKSPKERQERVEECLKMVGLGNRMTHMPAEMSGGEQQRVAIARAFAHHPRLILADEPTAELDSAMAAEITRIFQEMTRREGITVVMTTHDVGLMGAGDQIIELENGGRIYS